MIGNFDRQSGSGSDGQSFLDHLAGNQLQDCFRFWCAQRREGLPPLKSAIDPTEMPRKILPYLFIYELLDTRFRCRLAGTMIVNAFREDPTGLYLDQLLPPAANESRTRLFMGVVERALPVVYGGKLAAGPNDWMSFKRLLLPVSKTGLEVDIIFGMVIFPHLPRNKESGQSDAAAHDVFEAWASPEDLVRPDRWRQATVAEELLKGGDGQFLSAGSSLVDSKASPTSK